MKENNERDDVDGDSTRCTLARGNSCPLLAPHCLVPGASGPCPCHVHRTCPGRSYAPPPRPLCSFAISNAWCDRSIYEGMETEIVSE